MTKRILVRIDDVCPTMDYNRFWDRINYLRRHGIKPLLGVIPDCKDPSLQYGEVEDFWNMIQDLEKDGYTIAMHGFTHVYTTKKRGLVCFRRLSEFSGLSYEQQVDMLLRGKKILEEHGIHAKWFMAPGHSYDRNTIRALKVTGFQFVSDGRSGVPYSLNQVLFVPASSMWRSPFNGNVVTVCLHPNTDTDKSFNRLQSYIERNLENIASFAEAEGWEKWPYFICRADELLRMCTEKIAFSLYDIFKKGFLCVSVVLRQKND